MSSRFLDRCALAYPPTGFSVFSSQDARDQSRGLKKAVLFDLSLLCESLPPKAAQRKGQGCTLTTGKGAAIKVEKRGGGCGYAT